jgi:two-component system chemotaxis sensor kinase CheA
MTQDYYYIAPAAAADSLCYKISLTYNPTIQMANMHAYKTIYALKEIAEDIIYSPQDILTNEKSAGYLVQNGFSILLKTRAAREEILAIVRPGYDLDAVDVTECSEEEFSRGFDGGVQEQRADGTAGTYVPGDFVLSAKAPGKAKTLAKDKAYLRVDASQMEELEQLSEDLRKLIVRMRG